MLPDVNLKKIQRKVYMSYFQDGIWDIFLGLFLLGWGLSIITEAVFLPGVFFVVIYFTIWGVKKWLTYPRMGYVKFSATSRRIIKTRFVILLTAVFLLGFLVSLLMGIGTTPQWLTDYFPLLFNGMLALIVCLAAYWVRVNRFYLHAALIFLAAVSHQWLGFQWEFGFIGAGSIIVLIGLGFLISFLRKYPKLAEESSDDSR